MNKIQFLSRATRGLSSIIFFWLYIPHFIAYLISGRKRIIDEDLSVYDEKTASKLPRLIALLFLLHNNRWFRTLFYFRIGLIWSFLISWLRPGDSTCMLPPHLVLGRHCKLDHAFATILNAESIGDNFFCLQNVTVGKKNGMRPVIGNNVTVYAHSIIIGGIRIGDNAVIGAGSVVVKDVPNHAVVAGNPAKILKIIS